MKATLTLLYLVYFVCVQTKSTEIQLSNEEEECIRIKGISRDLVIQDKLGNRVASNSTDSTLFNEYLGCYVEKLHAIGKLHFTKNVFISLPGYTTRYQVKSVYCNEDYYSPTDRQRPCAQRF